MVFKNDSVVLKICSKFRKTTLHFGLFFILANFFLIGCASRQNVKQNFQPADIRVISGEIGSEVTTQRRAEEIIGQFQWIDDLFDADRKRKVYIGKNKKQIGKEWGAPHNIWYNNRWGETEKTIWEGKKGAKKVSQKTIKYKGGQSFEAWFYTRLKKNGKRCGILFHFNRKGKVIWVENKEGVLEEYWGQGLF